MSAEEFVVVMSQRARKAINRAWVFGHHPRQRPRGYVSFGEGHLLHLVHASWVGGHYAIRFVDMEDESGG